MRPALEMLSSLLMPASRSWTSLSSWKSCKLLAWQAGWQRKLEERGVSFAPWMCCWLALSVPCLKTKESAVERCLAGTSNLGRLFDRSEEHTSELQSRGLISYA